MITMRPPGFILLFFLLTGLKTSPGKSFFTSLPADKKTGFHFIPPLIPIDQKEKSSIDTNSLKNSGWYSQVIKNIEESEYGIQWDKNTNKYVSPNRRQGLRAFYTPDKFILQPRNDSEGKWRLQLQLKGIYAGKELIYQPVDNPAIEQTQNTIRFHHNDQFTVEYINSKEGVRQNFIINKQPVCNPKKLKLNLEVNKGWFINKVDEKEIHFAKETKNGYEKKIIYKGLKVWDSNGKPLQASFEVNKNVVHINVLTQNAAFPITIDPISTTVSTQLEINQAAAFMGISVASAGDVNGDGYSDVIVGAYLFDTGLTDEGAAFVYLGSATGITTTIQTQLGCNKAGAYLGNSVASAGDVNGDGYSDVIVGAYNYSNGEMFEGAAFVYHGSAIGINPIIKTQLESNQDAAFMGNSVASAGDVNGDGYSDVIVGAYQYDNPLTDAGAAFVFLGSAAGITTTIQAQLVINQINSFMGTSVASAGDVNGDGYSDVIVGAYNYSNGNTSEGAAFVFHGSASGITNTIQTQLEGNQTNAQMGTSVASAGDVNGDGYSDVVVGAPFYDNGLTDEGAAFVYHGSAAGITTTIQTQLEGNQINAHMGTSVASAGDVNGDGYSDVIVGAPFYDNVQTDEGAAFVYHGSAAGITTTIQSQLESNQINAQMGTSVSSAGDVNGDGYSDVIVGAPNYDNADIDEGAAFIYHGSAAGLSNSININLDDANQAGAQFGFSVACAGDVNGDGYSDVIIGANVYDGGNVDEGRAFVYYGSLTGLSAIPIILDDGNQVDARFGSSVASAGDVNGDGYSDVIVGAFLFDDGPFTDEGRAFVYYGSVTGLSTTPDNILDDANQMGASFGRSVASAGDVNGDGFGDVIIGSYTYDDGSVDEGRAFVYYGSLAGLSATPNRILDDANQANAFFGFSVASAGDINGDGYGDVIVGAHQFSNPPYLNEGRVFVYYGSLVGLSATPAILDTDQSSAFFGYSLASAGDVNGDGYGDVIVGAYLYNDGVSNDEGEAFVYYGSSTGLPPVASFIAKDADQPTAFFGICVASAGDVNGDGYSDVIIGADQYFDAPNLKEGLAFLYYGSPTGLSSLNNTPNDADEANAFFGFAVASAGDVNGDGYSDVIIGAYGYDDGLNSNEGRAYVYYGNDAGGLRNNLRLYNSDLITPIQQFNMSEPNLFGAGLFVKSPIGRQKGKLVWQTVKNGNPFSGNPITNSTAYTDVSPSYTDLGIAGIELKKQIAKQTNAKATYIRARVKYAPATAITGQVYGPWRYPESFLRGRRDIGAVALPVKFVSFTAVKQNYSALLKWITREEEPGVLYEVQHSTDGRNFTTIGALNGRNQQQTEYYWLHNDPAPGKNYYRIRAVLDDKQVFSSVKQLNFSSDELIHIYPNPISSNQSLTIELSPGVPVTGITLMITNLAGQTILQKQIEAGNGNVQVIIPAITAGQYIIILSRANESLYKNKLTVIK